MTHEQARRARSGQRKGEAREKEESPERRRQRQLQRVHEERGELYSDGVMRLRVIALAALLFALLLLCTTTTTSVLAQDTTEVGTGAGTDGGDGGEEIAVDDDGLPDEDTPEDGADDDDKSTEDASDDTPADDDDTGSLDDDDAPEGGLPEWNRTLTDPDSEDNADDGTETLIDTDSEAPSGDDDMGGAEETTSDAEVVEAPSEDDGPPEGMPDDFAEAEPELAKDIAESSKEEKSGKHAKGHVESQIIESAPKTFLDHGDGDIGVNDACSGDIKHHCKDVTPGMGRLAKCLYRAHLEPKRGGIDDHHFDVSSDCVEEVQTLLQGFAENINKDVETAWSCKADAKKFCPKEKLKKIEGRDETDVLSCLKDNVEELEHDCKYGVENMIMLAMEDYRNDYAMKRACEGDAKRLCKNVKPGNHRIYDCLEEKANKMSFGCQKEYFRQQMIAVGHENFRFAYKLHEKCPVEVEKFCRDVKPGNSRVIECLRVHKNDFDFSKDCRDELHDITSLELSDFRLDGSLRRACKKDAEKLCKKELKQVQGDVRMAKHGLVIHCLEERRTEIEDPSCQKEVHKAMAQIAESYDNDAWLQLSCDDLAKDKCADVRDDERTECLDKFVEEFEKKNDDKHLCSHALFEHHAIMSGSIDFHPKMRKACTTEIENMCKAEADSKVDGAVIKCLEKKMWEESFSENCEHEVKRYEHAAAEDYRKDVELANVCIADINRMCDFKCVREKGLSCEGRVQSCLKENFDRINVVKCRKRVRDVVWLGMEDYMNDFYLTQHCDADAHKHCDDERQLNRLGHEWVYSCLKTNIKKLTMKCGEALMAREAMYKGVISVGPTVKKMCYFELLQHCRHHDEDAMGQKLQMQCLMKMTHSVGYKGLLTKSCSQAIEQRIHFTARFIKNFAGMNQCSGDLKKLCNVDLKKVKYQGNDANNPLTCLIEKAWEASPVCRVEVQDILRNLYRFHRYNKPITKACDIDIRDNCAKSGGEIKEHGPMKGYDKTNAQVEDGGQIALEKYQCILRMGPSFQDASCKYQLDFMRTGRRSMNEKQLKVFNAAIDGTYSFDEINRMIETLNLPANEAADLAPEVKQMIADIKVAGGDYSAIRLTGWVAFAAIGALIFVVAGASFFAYKHWAGGSQYRPYTIVTKSGDV